MQPDTRRAELTAADIEALVADATLAPSIHNTQPWRFRGHDDVVDVYADAARGATVVDPWGSALALSVGAAVLNLRLSAAVRLRREPVTRLLPRPAEPTYLASVRLAGPRAPTVVEQALFAAIPRRHTSRAPFTERRPPAETLERLQTAARAEGALLDVLDPARTALVLQLAGQAERTWADDAAYRAELARWTTEDPDRDDGVPVAAFGPRDRLSHLRDFGAAAHVEGRPSASFEPNPLLAVLSTTADRPADHLRAGQALQRVLLTATDADLSVGLLHQPVEVPDLRRILRDPRHGPAYAHLVLRLGYAVDLPAGSPRRRPVSTVLDVEDRGQRLLE